MAKSQKFVIPGAGTLPGFGLCRRGKLVLLGDPLPARTGVYNTFEPLWALTAEEEAAAAAAAAALAAEQEAEAAAAAAALAVEEAVVAAPASGPPAGVADAPSWWRGVLWVVITIAIAVLAWVFFVVLPGFNLGG